MGDNITRPDHYCYGRKYEPKDVIRDWGLNFNLGSAVKYISRAGRKGDKAEDLMKAMKFLEFEIEAATKEDIVKCYADGILKEIGDIDTVPDEYKDRVIGRIVEMIDNGELSRMDIPIGLYMGCSRIRAAIANRGYRKIEAVEKEEHKDDIGMICKEAAAIGDAIAKGFKEGFKEDKTEHEPTTKVKKRFIDHNIGKDLWLKQEESDTFTISFKVEED